MSLPQSTSILIVGAGPVGLACATTLLVQGFKEFVIVDGRTEEMRPHSRALVVHARTLELLDTIGCSAPLIARGTPQTSMQLNSSRAGLLIRTDASHLPSKYNFILSVPQSDTEEVLCERFKELGGSVVFGKKAEGMSDAEGGKVVHFEGRERVKAKWVVGADGTHSVIRQLADIPYRDPTSSRTSERFVLADVTCTSIGPSLNNHPPSMYFSPAGPALWIPLPGNTHRLIGQVVDADLDAAPKEPGKEYLQNLMDDRLPAKGTVIREVLWSSRFDVRYRIADAFFMGSGEGGVALVGDAAHVHSPAGGQGMNLGIRDAITLAGILSSPSPTASSLQDWAKTRRDAGLGVISMTQRLTSVATLPPGIGRWVRDWVMWCVGCMPWVGQRAMYGLSGLAERVA